MAEKGGGKGFSMPKQKSSLKSSLSKDGKNDSSTKSKRGRKVQFESNEKGVSAAKINFSSTNGGKSANGGKASSTFPQGKGEKTSSGIKSPAPKPPQPLELNVEQELPKNGKCLMACEAADILQRIQEQMVSLSKDPSIKIPELFHKGLPHAKRGSHYTDSKSARQTLEALKLYGVSDGEICVIADVCPETVDEAFALVPSLKAKKRALGEHLKESLSQLAKLKKPEKLVI
ncbi:hypothetical protein UlMin_016523 [Ulmus minor]